VFNFRQFNKQLLLSVGAAVGLLVTAVRAGRVSDVGLIEAISAHPFTMLAGMLSGALVATLVWTIVHPRSVGRLAAVFVTVNCAAWLLYLVVNPRIGEVGGDPVLQQRAQYDADEERGWPDGINLVSHPSALLAGRPLTWVGLSEKPLGLMAGPAVAFCESLTVPERYWQTGATIKESYWIAAAGFVLSTAWWVAVPTLWSFVRSRRWTVARPAA
jgi:hypothetical protein